MTSIVQFLRPSSAHTWVVCSGYPLMRSHFPDEPEEADTDIREDGTACHWLAQQAWIGKAPPLNSISPNGRVLDESMFDAVDEYLDVLRGWDVPEIYVERPLDCSAIYPGMTGTPDACAANYATRTIYIADLKYGFRFVEVWYNWQLLCYILALLHTLGINGDDESAWTIEATICQPRSNHRDGPVRTWRIKASELRAHFNILIGAAADCMKPEAPCTPNPGCTDCPARHACVALQNAALSALEQSYAGIPLVLSAAAAGDELRRLKEASKRMEARITGLSSQVEGLLRAGQSVPHFSLEPTFARERWRDGMEQQVITLGSYYNVQTAKPQQPITPAQARKVLPASVVAMFSHKPSTGVKLAKYDPLQAQKKFNQTK